MVRSAATPRVSNHVAKRSRVDSNPASRFLRQLVKRVHCGDVAMGPQAADHGGGGVGDLRMTVVLVAGVDVGDVHLDHRSLERLDRIDDGDRGEGIGGRIDDDGIGALPRRLDQVDQLAFMVRLVKGKRKSKLGRFALASLLDLRQRRGAVNMRLAHAEQVEVGAVEDYHSFHVFFLEMVFEWFGLLTSPACGGGRRARQSAAGGGKSVHSASAFCGGTPTPTLPRKRRAIAYDRVWRGGSCRPSRRA